MSSPSSSRNPFCMIVVWQVPTIPFLERYEPAAFLYSTFQSFLCIPASEFSTSRLIFELRFLISFSVSLKFRFKLGFCPFVWYSQSGTSCCHVRGKVYCLCDMKHTFWVTTGNSGQIVLLVGRQFVHRGWTLETLDIHRLLVCHGLPGLRRP